MTAQPQIAGTAASVRSKPPVSLFPWRAPLAGDWSDRLGEVDAEVRSFLSSDEAPPSDLCLSLRRLACQQLGPREELRLEQLAKRLLRLPAAPAGLRRFRLGLIGSRTLSYLMGPLAAAGLARGLLVEAVDAPYGAATSFALGAANPFEGVRLEAIVVVLDEQAFVRDAGLLDIDREAADLQQAAALLEAIAASARELCQCPVIMATLPENAPRTSSADLATVGSHPRFARGLNQIIVDGASRGGWLLWDLAALSARVGHAQWRDPVRFHAAKVPFRIELCPLVADNLCALIAAMTGKAARVLALDLDNTLWGGVIGDDGLDGIRLGQNSAEGEAYVSFQRFVLQLRAQGVVIAACSKNTDEIARAPFRAHPDMVLREDHIAVFQANWQDKATNLRAIAESLNLGLESLVFVDDNPAERERVRQELPLVATPEVGADPSYFEEIICASGAFEHLRLNADDLGRAAAYGARARQAVIKAQIGNYDEYLKSLKMRMDIRPFDDVGRDRIAQLINKSNQFNLTTRRYNEEDVRRLQADPGRLCWQVRLDDAFGAQGMIGVVIVERLGPEWAVDTWLQSCRILERGVEETIMNQLMAEARAAGVEVIRGEYIPTEKNGLVAGFFPRLGFEPCQAASAAGRQAYLCKPAEHRALKSFIEVQRTA